jgi:flagellar export protein FliJ
MAYRFPLATVLRVRENLEKREERALQKIQLEVARVLRQLDELSAEIAKAHDAREQVMQRPIAAGQLQALLWAMQATVEKRKTLVHHLHALEQERDKQMNVYRAAHRDREMLTDMFDRRCDAYEQEQARSEQKKLDDIFIARHNRSEPNLPE